MAQYELVLLGSPTAVQAAGLHARFAEVAAEFGMAMPTDIAIRTAAEVGLCDPKASTAALYFGGDPDQDLPVVDALKAARVPIVPVLAPGARFGDSIPAKLGPINACFIDPADGRLDSLSAVALECLGLLHRQRRVFVSYRRNDSRDVAVQLHDELSARGFDVFLDTHDIRPGEEFQEMLWHRLADCDVVVMLDTVDYFASKWTKQELGRTQAKGIAILRLIWPGHVSSRHLSLSDTIQLAASDLTVRGRLADPIVDEVARRTESLRSRSVANRHREIAGKLRVEVERIGGTFEGIGAHRAIAFSLPNGAHIQAYPVVGVPTAELLNDVHTKAASNSGSPCLVYDHIGIRAAWLSHLDWLDEQITDVRTLKVLDAGWELAAWDS